MTLEEANKIIAEYMGTTIEIIESINYAAPTTYDKIITKDYKYTSKWYSESLDALVPVWEKMRAAEFKFVNIEYDCCGWFLDIDDKTDVRKYGRIGLSIQEAACIATAKAIKELKEENNG